MRKELIASAIVMLGMTSCKDLSDIEPDAQGMDASTHPSLTISGEEGYLTLPLDTLEIAEIIVPEEGFLTDISRGKIYAEQNDEGTSRKAEIKVIYKNGVDTTIYLTQAPGEASRQFYRHHGIGYSYNALEGYFCNLRDFRCQILNRAVIDRIEKEKGTELMRYNPLSHTSINGSTYTSVVDYIHNSNIRASASGSIVLFSGTASYMCSLFEYGERESYILTNKISLDRAEYSLGYLNIVEEAAIPGNESILTSSFRSALAKIKTEQDIDDFIYRYGTHVVTYSKLGARLSLDVQVDLLKFNYQENTQLLSEEMIATMFQMAANKEHQQGHYQILENSRCNLQILGGDLTTMEGALKLRTFKNDGMTEGMINRWMNSVYHDDNDLANSNVELIDMDVTPIWEFIPDEDLAERIQARVTGNCEEIIESLDNVNFLSTSFEINPASVTCRIGTTKETFSNPDVVEVIAANRHVATLCHEYVPEIEPDGDVWVVYPIYEGHVKLLNGLCINRGKAYKVAWYDNKFHVEEYEENPTGNTIYMNLGELSLSPSANLSYQPSHLILGCERPGGIKTDGSLGGKMVKIKKYLGHFYLENNTRYDNLPGWSFTNTAAEECLNYGSPGSAKTFGNRMVRNPDYTYIFNPTEIGYE
ncbi:MAG: hypothetical protein K2H96_10330 [Muribaculaceae bacterium]|nr:hypothetical protein [Muribaculaceae bacterium]